MFNNAQVKLKEKFKKCKMHLDSWTREECFFLFRDKNSEVPLYRIKIVLLLQRFRLDIYLLVVFGIRIVLFLDLWVWGTFGIVWLTQYSLLARLMTVHF